MDIAARKQRLDAAADAAARKRVAWYGATGDTCPRCHVQVPAGYMLALADTDINGCLRCLELQAHLSFSGLDALPPDLAGIGGQRDALRSIAEEFRYHVRAITRGGTPRPRRPMQARQAPPSGWAQPPAGRSKVRPAKSARPSRGRAPGAQGHGQDAETKRRPDPAEVLGLSGAPSRAEVIAAFRRSALICHPDFGGSAADFRALVAARDALLAAL